MEKSVICRITCPGCFQKHAGKTNRNLITRLDKHDTKTDQPMYQDLSSCNAFNDHIMLFTLPDEGTNSTVISKELYLHNALINNDKNS